MRTWRTFLLAGVAAVALGVLLGSTLQAAVGQAVGIAALVAIRVGVRRWRPQAAGAWWLCAAGGASFLVGNVVRAVHGAATGIPDPFPSPADLFFVVGYALLIAGEVAFVRRRSADIEGDNLIDSLIVATAIGVLVWAYVLVPIASGDAFGLVEKLLATAYSLADLVLVAVAVRLAVGSGHRSPSYYLLGGALAAIVLADVVTTLQASDQAASGLVLASSALCFVLFGAGALHPSMARLTEKPASREIQLTRRRLGLLCFALLLGPGLSAVQAVLGMPVSVPVLASGSVLLALLVLARLAGLVRAKERKAARERVLRDASAALVAAMDRHDLHGAALTALLALAGSASTTRVSVAENHDGVLSVVAALGDGHADALGVEVGLEELPPESRSSLVAGLPAVVERPAPVDLPPGPHHPVVVLLVPLWARRSLHGAFVVTTTRRLGLEATPAIQALADHVSLALESAALTEEVHRRRHERRFRALIEHSSDLVTVIGADGLVSFASPAAKRLLGVDEAELVGAPPFERVHPDDRPRAAGLLDFVWAGLGLPEPVEVRMRHADGDWRWFEILADDLTDEPEVAGLVTHARDVTDRRAAQAREAERETRFRALVQHASDVIFVVDGDLRVEYVSPSVSRVLGRRPEELEGAVIVDHVHADDADAARLAWCTPRDRDMPLVTEARIRHADGGWRTVEVTVSDLREEPGVGGIVLNARDVTERRRLERELRHQALHDELTGLANRTLFTDRVGHALARRGQPADVIGVLFLDLDDFKTVNDGLGHVVGDALLRTVADRLASCVREADTAARLGGDEFAVLVEGLTHEADVLDVAERVLATLREPFDVEGRSLQVGASVGIAVDHDRTTSAEVLLRNADVAMYLAKSRGKGRAELFEPGLQAVVFERLELKEDLARAVEREEFHLLYQPIVDLVRDRCHGVEALVRWDNPQRGLVTPDLFIPLAEETGLIVPIGRQVLQEAAAQLRRWRRQEPSLDVGVSVNLSVRQLGHPALLSHVTAALEAAEADPSWLTLEITESLLMADVETTRERLAELKALGVTLAIDDFGSGYSSLGYLQRFPVDVLKIDRSLIDPLGTREQQTDVVRAVIEVAHSHGLTTVAEGVENAEQLAVLRVLGCDAAQGYHFARPLPSQMVEPFVRVGLAERLPTESAARH